MASIRKRGNKYQVQIRRNGFAPSVRTFHNRKDALEWSRHMDIKADRGELPSPLKVLDQHTVKDILQRYKKEITIKKRSKHIETYTLNAFMKHSIANLKLSQVKTSHFSKYREKRLQSVKAGTVNTELGIIQHAFETAKKEWDIPIIENPLASLKKLPVNNTRNRRLNKGELECLLTAAEYSRNAYIKPFILFALETAMRRGELNKAKWQHFDEENRLLHIPETKNGHSRKYL